VEYCGGGSGRGARTSLFRKGKTELPLSTDAGGRYFVIRGGEKKHQVKG